MSLEKTHYFQVITSNRDRAKWLQRVLPGGKSDHISWSPVDEERKKDLSMEPLRSVRIISEYKAVADHNLFGVSGMKLWMRELDQRGFTHLVKMTSDTVRIVYMPDGRVVTQHKPTVDEIDRLPEVASGRKSAILTAITELSIPIGQLLGGNATDDVEAYLATVVSMSEFQYRPFSSAQFADFVQDCGIGKMLRISGGIPINTETRNPLIDWDAGVRVTVISGSDAFELQSRGMVDPNRYVHGAFPEVVETLLATPGKPIAKWPDFA